MRHFELTACHHWIPHTAALGRVSATGEPRQRSPPSDADRGVRIAVLKELAIPLAPKIDAEESDHATTGGRVRCGMRTRRREEMGFWRCVV